MAHLEPPGGLSDEWKGVYQALTGQILVVKSFYSFPNAHLSPLASLVAWRDGLRRTIATARPVLTFLHGRAPKTWKAGHSIDRAIFPINGVLGSIVGFLTDPLPVALDPEKQAAPSRTHLAKLLQAFDWGRLLAELAAAVTSESSVKIDLDLAFKKIQRLASGAPLTVEAVPDSGEANDQSIITSSARGEEDETSAVFKAMLALAGDENSLAIVKIACDGKMTADQKMRSIYAIDKRALGWDSPKWADVLRVSDAAIRKTDWWKIDRPRLCG